MRINKYIAEQGIASRREADTLIEEGKVLVNGAPAVIGQQIGSDDVVEVVGSQAQKRYLAYYKGRGVITHSPAQGEVDIANKLKKDYGIEDIAPVGRLDKESEGLIILTDDGRVTGPLLDPAAANEKEYEVLADKPVTKHFLKLMGQGVNIEGYVTKPANVRQLGERRFSITLTEGKKHQIRRMCAALGFQVESLKRVRVMNIELGKLKPNQYRTLSGSELREFLSQLGIR